MCHLHFTANPGWTCTVCWKRDSCFSTRMLGTWLRHTTRSLLWSWLTAPLILLWDTRRRKMSSFFSKLLWHKSWYHITNFKIKAQNIYNFTILLLFVLFNLKTIIPVNEKVIIPVHFSCRMADGNNFAFHAKDEVRTFVFESCLKGADNRTSCSVVS